MKITYRKTKEKKNWFHFLFWFDLLFCIFFFNKFQPIFMHKHVSLLNNEVLLQFIEKKEH